MRWNCDTFGIRLLWKLQKCIVVGSNSSFLSHEGHKIISYVTFWLLALAIGWLNGRVLMLLSHIIINTNRRCAWSKQLALPVCTVSQRCLKILKSLDVDTHLFFTRCAWSTVWASWRSGSASRPSSSQRISIGEDTMSSRTP